MMTQEDRRDAPSEGDETGASSADLPTRWTGTGEALTSEEVERVIRRASDLQFRAGSPESDQLSEGEVIRIGEEVGLDSRYMRQALAEVRADSLVPVLPEESAVAARVFGPGLVRASRVVPGEPPEVEDRISEYLRGEELLKQIRSQPGRSLWEAAGGAVNTMRRAMDVRGREFALAKARSIAVDVEPLETGWSLVSITADMRNMRNERGGGWFFGLSLAAIPAAILLSVTGGPELPLLLGMGLSGGTALGTATWASSKHFRRQRERMELAVQGFLDRLERGEPLAADRDSLIDKVQEGLGKLLG
jgi:hypothetical protein